MDNEQFPSNSRSNRERETEPVDKVVEKVVVGKVVRRKKPLGRRLAETFVAGEAQGVGQYILFDVLIPAAKDLIADVVSQGVEKYLFGDARSSSRRTGYRPSGGPVSYNRYSSSAPWNRDRRDESRVSVSRRSRANHDFNEIILATRPEANEVIDRLFDLVSKYQQATVADLYELVGVSANFTDERWGWTELRGAGVTRVRDGYLLDLPKPELLD